MSAPEQESFDDYQSQLEQHELVKQEGVAAWADAVAEMMPTADPGKKLLIKEGLKAMLSGPPSMKIPPMPDARIDMIDAEFVKPVPQIFEETREDGSVTVWDWYCLASRGTHATRAASGKVAIFKGDELLITLDGIAAEKFWEWKTDAIKRMVQVYPGPALRRPL
jgi:hypothetical protein